MIGLNTEENKIQTQSAKKESRDQAYFNSLYVTGVPRGWGETVTTIDDATLLLEEFYDGHNLKPSENKIGIDYKEFKR